MARLSTGRPCDAPRLSVALARLVDLKAALLAEARARGPDGQSEIRGERDGISAQKRSVTLVTLVLAALF